MNSELAFAISSFSLAEAHCRSSEARTALIAAQDRLQSFAHVHRSLQMPDYSTRIDVTAYLLKLCQAICHSKLESQGIQLSLSFCPLRMSSARCWYLGMIVFEFITNAARHVFNRGPGQIRFELFHGSLAECRIADNGTSDADIRPGTGLKIVGGARPQSARYDRRASGSQGTRSVLIFP